MRWLVAALAVVLVAVWLRAWTGAHSEFDSAENARSAGEIAAAINHYQYAMRWYTPGASTPFSAADALNEIADQAIEKGDRKTALSALRRLRGGILATRKT